MTKQEFRAWLATMPEGTPSPKKYSRSWAAHTRRKNEKTVRFERHREDFLYNSGENGLPFYRCTANCPKRYGYCNVLS